MNNKAVNRMLSTKQTFSKSVSVVVTVYDETWSIRETIKRLLRTDQGRIREILLVVHPKASKETFDICRDFSETHDFIKVLIQKRTPGVGWAIREGMEAATGDYVALLSSDLETEPEALDRMMTKVEQTHCDLVIGNRWLKGGGFYNYDPTKRVLNWIFQILFRMLYRTPLGDLTYGYKVLKKERIDQISWESSLHEIYIETTIKPLKIGCKADQVPTVWVGRSEGKSKNTFFKNFRYVGLAFKVWAGKKERCLKKGSRLPANPSSPL